MVYDELRRLAAARLAQERPDHTLRPTALAHEPYLRLAGEQQFENRGHFFAAAGEAMRRVLVENPRRRGRLKRGGRPRAEVADQPAPDTDAGLLALDDVLTSLLNAAAVGDRHAAAELLPLVYGELRALADARMAAEAPGQMLQATALVHEACLRLIGPDDTRWQSRGNFFAATAEPVRRILIEQARRKQVAKAGGGWQRHELIEADLAVDSTGDDFFGVNEALSRLAAAHSRAARLVHLRFFLGQTLEEAAANLGLQARTAYRDWASARAWLRGELDRGT